ncbi:acyltransferase family protein [Tsukamurella soli]|uniref:Acyltransferase 3 domain-containing protein n=1 Tax=Tsukamurella soli TaxID=644556 RepID=A0ABP8K0J0_9ACTN
MPRPTHNEASYLPGLDGLRAIAVIFVIGYHLGAPGFGGGLLGVGVFFTLSGFLITSLLIRSRERTGGLELGTFWLRRARRLLPALVLVLAATLATAAIATPTQLGRDARQSLSALLYVNNWYTISGTVSYFDRFSGPAPLSHLWSLSIEEQFYLVWPLLLAGLYRLSRRRWAVTLAVLAMSAASFYLLRALAHPGFDTTRAYEGTDTRAGGLLLGAALAFWWPARKHTVGERARTWIDVLGLAGVALMIHLVVDTFDGAMSLYRSGILLCTIATLGVLIAAVTPQTLVASLLSLPPLRWIGERSYGIYLWHMPVIAFLPVAVRTGSHLFSALVVIAATLLLATLSWTFVEDPVRRYGFRAALTALRPAEDTVLYRTTAYLIARLEGAAAALTRLQQHRLATALGTTVPAGSTVPTAVSEHFDATEQPPAAPGLDATDCPKSDGAEPDRENDPDVAPDLRALPTAPVPPSESDTVRFRSVPAEPAAPTEDLPGVSPTPSYRPVPICRTLAVPPDTTAEQPADPHRSEQPESAPPESEEDEAGPAAPAESLEDAVEDASEEDASPADDPVAGVVGSDAEEPAGDGDQSGAELPGHQAPSDRRVRPRRPRLRAAVTTASVIAVAVVVMVGASAVSPTAAVVRALADAPAAQPTNDITDPGTPQATPVGPTLQPAARRTRCSTVVHIGDSTSIGMNSADTLPDPATRLVGRYEQYGASNVITDISGGRSSLEEVDGQPNATKAIKAIMARGVRGCWVIAMGLNDAANVEVGGEGPVDMRIDRLLQPIGNQPVLWPTVITNQLNSNPAYAEPVMQNFNRALLRACKRYPNLRIYDWAGEVDQSWFLDGIHYTATGDAERARRFAVALATEFPKTDFPPAGCVLTSTSAVVGAPGSSSTTPTAPSPVLPAAASSTAASRVSSAPPTTSAGS